MSDGRAIVGIARSYNELRQVLRERRQALGLTHLQVDDIAGLQNGYTGKLEIGTKNFGPMSLSSLLGALGVQIELVRTGPAHQDLDDATKASLEKAKIHRQKFSAKGGRTTARNRTPEQRRAAARKAANARWKWQELKAKKSERERRAARRAAGDDKPEKR